MYLPALCLQRELTKKAHKVNIKLRIQHKAETELYHWSSKCFIQASSGIILVTCLLILKLVTFCSGTFIEKTNSTSDSHINTHPNCICLTFASFTQVTLLNLFSEHEKNNHKSALGRVLALKPLLWGAVHTTVVVVWNTKILVRFTSCLLRNRILADLKQKLWKMTSRLEFS